MGTFQLKAPGPDFPLTPLDVEMVSPSLLYRVSSHDSGEPFFGRSGGCRFDDASKVVARRFGTCYLGLSLTVAFAESVIHDVEPTKGMFFIPEDEITRRFALSFQGPDLRLANLTGTSLLVLGGNAELTGTSDYTLPQQWASAVVSHPDKVDGFFYMSRRVNDSIAVVLFERAPTSAPALTMSKVVRLDKHPDFLATVKKLRIKAVT